jgi:YD repeat-containing protein
VDFVSFGSAGHWREAEATSLPEVPIHRRFDGVGNPIVPAAGLQRGGVLDHAHDRDRWLVSVAVAATDETGTITSMASVEFERRADGQPLAIRRPLGADHELEYDALGRLVRVCERVLGACNDTWFEYDAAGRQTAIERSNGMREELDYDGYGRVVGRRALRDGVLEGEQTFSWEEAHVVGVHDSIRGDTRTLVYDGAGRPESESHSTNGEIRLLKYDARSRLVRETFVAPPVLVGGDPQTLSLVYEYDLADRRIRVLLDDGSPQGELLRETVIEDGRVVRVVDGNGNERENLFDPETGRLVGFQMTDAALQVVEDTTIAHSVELGPTRYQVRTQTTTALATTAEEYWLNRPGSLLDPNGRVGMRIFRARGWDDAILTHERS